MSQPETQWYYQGDDGQEYGAFSSSDMMKWVKSGFFPDHLPLRTSNDNRWYTLASWTQACNGQLPFMMQVSSMDALIEAHMKFMSLQQMRPMPSTAPFLMLSPLGVQNPNVCFSPTSTMNQPTQHFPQPTYTTDMRNGLVMNAPPAFLQGACEHNDENLTATNSQTPDSDMLPCTMDKMTETTDAPWNCRIDAGNNPKPRDEGYSRGCQTTVKVSYKDVVTALSHLFGTKVEIDLENAKTQK